MCVLFNVTTYTLAEFLEMEGTFNNVKIESIKEGLVTLRVEKYIIEWITNMLQSGIVYSEIGEASMKKRITKDTPQEGVISPLL